jgi:hypothetical protein
MARRTKAQRKVRRRQAGIKVLNVAEAYVQGAIITDAFFGTSPIGFLFGDTGPSFAVSGGGVSLVEMVRSPDTVLTLVGSRLMNPERVLTVALKSAGANLAFRMGRKLLRRNIQSINKNFMVPIFGRGSSGVAL